MTSTRRLAFTVCAAKFISTSARSTRRSSSSFVCFRTSEPIVSLTCLSSRRKRSARADGRLTSVGAILAMSSISLF